MKKGSHHTEEAKLKNREKHLGKYPSKETKIKLSEKRKGRQPTLGYHHSEDSKKQISNTLKGRIPWNKGVPMSEETKIKMSESQKGRKGNPCSEITKKKLSKLNKGKKLTEETKLKISKSERGRIPSSNNGYGKGSYYNSPLQGEIWLRSSYELKFSQYLDSKNIPWLYEIQTFDLGNTTYIPDFYLPTCNMFIEIKGYMREEARKKIDRFLDIYNDEILLILRKEDLIKLGIELK